MKSVKRFGFALPAFGLAVIITAVAGVASRQGFEPAAPAAAAESEKIEPKDFIWHEKPYSAAIVLFWVGQSILNVWVYAADSVVMQLVLTSGFTGTEGSFHDWNYMLTQTGLLGSTKIVAGIIRLAGTLVIIAAGVSSIYYSLFPSPTDDEI